MRDSAENFIEATSCARTCSVFQCDVAAGFKSFPSKLLDFTCSYGLNLSPIPLSEIFEFLVLTGKELADRFTEES
jgi:hypothetical protein